MTREVEFAGLKGTVDGDGQRGAVIISHGAGRGLDAPILAKTAQNLATLGFVVLRYNFSYLTAGRAPSAGGKKEQPELAAALEFMADYGPPILVGKSFGARVSTYVAMEQDDIKAMVFYGLPLQGISKNAKPRDWSHMAKIKSPCLFITGDKDKLCPLDQLQDLQKSMPAAVTSHVVPGDHSFHPKSEEAAIQLCTKWLDRLS